MSWEVVLDGDQDEVRYLDQHANHVDLISIEPGVTGFPACRGEVETRRHSRRADFRPADPAALALPAVHATDRAGEGDQGVVADLGKDPDPSLETLHELMALVADRVVYDKEPTGPATTAEEAVTLGHGVCQDHAHVFLSAARLMGFPARYASGYMMMLDRVDQEAGHAWAEAFVDGLGWVGFDAANRLCPDERYIRVATGLDYREAGPLTGVMYGGGRDSLSVTVQVQQ
ncbi:MAG: transglutaminase family protein [Hyphomonas sp.]